MELVIPPVGLYLVGCLALEEDLPAVPVEERVGDLDEGFRRVVSDTVGCDDRCLHVLT